MKPEMKSIHQISSTLAKGSSQIWPKQRAKQEFQTPHQCSVRTWLSWACNRYNRDRIELRQCTEGRHSFFIFYDPNSGALWNWSGRGSHRTGRKAAQLMGEEERKSLAVGRTKKRGGEHAQKVWPLEAAVQMLLQCGCVIQVTEKESI